MRAAPPAIYILVSACAPKILFCISRVRDMHAPLETVELDIPPGHGLRVL
jgi:hypothetical protein